MVRDLADLTKSELIETVERLQKDRAELERELTQSESLFPTMPIKAATRLIEMQQLKTEQGKVINGGYGVLDLKEIAEHLLVYTNNTPLTIDKGILKE